MNTNDNTTVGITNRGIPQIVQFDIVRIDDHYVCYKQEGSHIPAGQITEIKKLWITPLNTNKVIDLTNNVKEIRVNYGN